MRQLGRLLRYVAPYWAYVIASVVLMAAVGLLEAFRIVLIGPMLDRVLHPASQSKDIVLFNLPISHRTLFLQQLVPQRFTNAWTMVAFALVVSTALKGKTMDEADMGEAPEAGHPVAKADFK